MEHRTKKIDIKTIIIIIVVIIAIVEGIAIFTSNNGNSKENNIEALTEEEQITVDYLLGSIFKPYQTEIHKVWFYKQYDEQAKQDKYYFAYYISVESTGFFNGSYEFMYGNNNGILLKDILTRKETEGKYSDYSTVADKKGIELNAEKIQKAFREQVH